MEDGRPAIAFRGAQPSTSSGHSSGVLLFSGLILFPAPVIR
jgi:hypothetical protein